MNNHNPLHPRFQSRQMLELALATREASFNTNPKTRHYKLDSIIRKDKELGSERLVRVSEGGHRLIRVRGGKTLRRQRVKAKIAARTTS